MKALFLGFAVALSITPTWAFAKSRPPIPGTPSNVVATATSPSSVRITWNDNTVGESGFRIERKTDTTNFFLVTQTGPDVTSFDDVGLPDNTRYYYRVLAFDAGGATPPSPVATVNTPQGYWSLAGRVVEGNDFAPVPGATVSVLRDVSVQTPLYNPNATIPDNNAAGITEGFEITQAGPIENLAFAIKITHSYVDDLRVSLVHPDGTKVMLIDRNKSGRNLDTVFPTATAPVQSLDVFKGKSGQGLWSVEVSDLVGGDTGTLVSFQLTLTGTAASLAATTDSQGYYSFAEIASGNISIGVEAPNLVFTTRFVELRQNTSKFNFVSAQH